MTIGQFLVIAAIPIGLLLGLAAVLEGESKGKRRRYGLICSYLILASFVSSYLLAMSGECSQREILLLTKYCGGSGSLLARIHYIMQFLAVISTCAWLVSIWRGSLRRAKSRP